jgi:uncharacterized membrane protein
MAVLSGQSIGLERFGIGPVAGASRNLVAAALFTIPVLLTGLLAWQFALGGHKLKGILLYHLVLAAVTSAMIWLVGWIHFRAKRRASGELPLYRLPLESLAAALITLTAHLGGFLSGVNLPS